MFRLVSSQTVRLKCMKMAKIIPLYLRPSNRLYFSEKEGGQNKKASSQINSKNGVQTQVTTNKADSSQMKHQNGDKTQFTTLSKQDMIEMFSEIHKMQRAQEQNTKQRAQEQKAKQRLQQEAKQRAQQKEEKKRSNHKNLLIGGFIGMILNFALTLMFHWLDLNYFQISSRSTARKLQNQIKDDQKSVFIKKYLPDSEQLKGLDKQFVNKELQEKFKAIISTQEENQITGVNLIAGISGIGKTTTLKNIIREMGKMNEYKKKIYYISLGSQDKNLIDQSSNENPYIKDTLQKKLENLEIIISYAADQKNYSKEGKMKVQQKDGKYIAPIIFIDDISSLQNQKTQKQIVKYFQSLHDISTHRVRIFAISSSISFLQNLRQDKVIEKGNLCLFSVLEPLKDKTIKEILKNITERHLEKNKQKKSAIFKQNKTLQDKIKSFIENSGFLPRQANDALHSSITNAINSLKINPNQDVYQLILTELGTYRSSKLEAQIDTIFNKIKETQLYKNHKEIVIRTFDQMCKLKANNSNRLKCTQIFRNMQAEYPSIIQTPKPINDIFKLTQILNGSCFCYPRSQFMQEAMKKTLEKLKKSTLTTI